MSGLFGWERNADFWIVWIARIFLSEHEEGLIKILNDNDGKMMWRELVRKSGYNGKGFHRVLDKLEIKGRIVRRKVGRSLEVVVVG